MLFYIFGRWQGKQNITFTSQTSYNWTLFVCCIKWFLCFCCIINAVLCISELLIFLFHFFTQIIIVSYKKRSCTKVVNKDFQLGRLFDKNIIILYLLFGIINIFQWQLFIVDILFHNFAIICEITNKLQRIILVVVLA